MVNSFSTNASLAATYGFVDYLPSWLRPTVSVVIPTLNESENLPFVLPLIPEWVDEVVIVDGYSTDDTIPTARKLLPKVRTVSQVGSGKGAALRSGFAAATGDIIVMLDADGSTDPREIPAYVGALLAGADFAKGSRFLQGGGTSDMPLYRKLGNLGFVVVVRMLFGGSYTDLCYGYNAFWARILPALNLDCDGFEVETLMNVRALCAGLKVTEIPSFETPRVVGEGRLRALPDGWRVLKTIVRQWFKYPNMRGLRMTKVAANKPDNFTPAIQLLFKEALYLSRNHDHLSKEAYQIASDAVKETFFSLVEMDSDAPEIKRLQERYRRYYQGDVWQFFAQHALVEWKPID